MSPAETFGREIAEEVATCDAALASEGVGSVLLAVGPSTTVTRTHARRLLTAVAEGHLSFKAVNYVADALIMSEDFDWEDDAVATTIFFLADNSRPPTREEVRDALSQLDDSVR